MGGVRTAQFVVCSHPGLTDLFLTQARHEQRLRQPLTADEIKAEAARLLGKLQEPVQPNSPGGTHFMAEVSRDFLERAGAKDTAALQKLLPFSTCPHDPQRPQGRVCPDRQRRGPQPVPPASLRPLQAATGVGGAEAACRKEEGSGAVTWQSGNGTYNSKSA